MHCKKLGNFLRKTLSKVHDYRIIHRYKMISSKSLLGIFQELYQKRQSFLKKKLNKILFIYNYCFERNSHIIGIKMRI